MRSASSRRRGRRARWLPRVGPWWLASVLGVLGCALLAGPRPTRLPECPGALVSTHALGPDVLLRQRVRIAAADGPAVGLQLVVRTRGPVLTMVGLTALGAEAFTLTQEGTAVRIVSALGPAWPVPPVNLLRDLHRARFLGVPGGPFGDGVVRAEVDGTAIEETWRGGSLERRTLTRPGGPPGAVVVQFEAGPDGTARTRIANGWCDYEATIVTVAEERGR